jgi:hypothetical protein
VTQLPAQPILIIVPFVSFDMYDTNKFSLFQPLAAIVWEEKEITQMNAKGANERMRRMRHSRSFAAFALPSYFGR